MSLFRSKAEKELDAIINRLEMNMANNYKDNAQDNLKELETALESFKSAGKIKGKDLEAYEKLVSDYQGKMKGYTHKDQKPYWT